MTKQRTMRFAMPFVLCFVSLFVIAMCHLYFSAVDIHLSFDSISEAFRLGIITGLLIAVVGTLLKHPFWGITAGASICYSLSVGYIVVGRAIPIEWIY
ncbi:hypothetical protein [uncultured Gimesia sp.]|uniref:hypothetical protein n=1 Tax=uncultured Gimesia sp. TaxID=1678688 RepID=UPI00262799DF|nr:hypothetical protein [uncultured Gimesia sp.]